MLPAQRFGLFSPAFLKSIKAASLLSIIQAWIQQEIVADDPWDESTPPHLRSIADASESQPSSDAPPEAK